MIVWLYLNVLVFPPIERPRSWASRGIYGEKHWLSMRSELPRQYDLIQRRLILAQLWRIDRFSTLYELMVKERGETD